MPWEKRAIFPIFRRIFRFCIVLFIPFFNREDCQGALRCATKGDRFYLAVPKLGICSKIGAAGESPTSTQPHYVGDWSYFGTNFGNPNATNRIVRIGNFGKSSGPIRRLLLDSVVSVSRKYFNGGSRFKFAFSRHTGLIASISTGDTSTER